VAVRAGFESVADLQETLTEQMQSIRATYKRILAADISG
jgi:hypothetical protein